MADLICVALLGRNSLIREGLRLILTAPIFSITQLVEHPNALLGSPGEDLIIIVHENRHRNDWSYVDRLRAIFPSAKVVILADCASPRTVIAAFSFGVDSYLVNNLPPAMLASLLQLVAFGQKFMPPHVVDALVHRDTAPQDMTIASIPDLSAREREILKYLAAGAPNKVIARQLLITEATVKVHVKAILRKLNVSNRTQAAVLGMGNSVGQYSGAPPEGTRAWEDGAQSLLGTTRLAGPTPPGITAPEL